MGIRRMYGRLVVAFCLLLTAYCFPAFGQGGTGKLPPPRNPPPFHKLPPRRDPFPPPQSACSAKSPKQATGRTHTVNLNRGVKLEMVEVPAGSFCMGSLNGGVDEKPLHRVTISGAFYIGKYEVTQAQWQAVMGTTVRQQRDKIDTSFPLSGEGNDYPMYYVSWDEAQEFLRRLNQANPGYLYRLPTEAEWEYACRAGTTGEYSGDVDSMAWYAKNSGGGTHPVGQKQANGFGLYDMHGNVYEWCQDWYDKIYYGASPGTDPKGPGRGEYRVLRGGVFGFDALGARSASRMPLAPDERDVYYGHGFRVIAVARTQ